MTKHYKTPPLIEAICEFRFPQSEPADWTIPGLIYNQIQDDYPDKDQVNIVEIGADPINNQPIPIINTRMRFTSIDRTRLVNVSPDSISISQLAPYTSWENFKPQVLAHLDIFNKIVHPEQFMRIGLRYINRIELPIQAEINDYFRILPNVPDPVPQIYQSFVFQVVIPHSEPSAQLKLVFGSIPPINLNTFPCLLDLDMATEPDSLPTFEQVSKWLDTAHSRVEAAFEAAITDKARQELFEEIKP